MILFGYRFSIAKRFFFFLGGLIIAAILLIVFFPTTSQKKPNLLLEPAFSPTTLSSLHGDWLGPYISSQNLFTPTLYSQFTGANFPLNVGQPMKLEIYVPTTEDMSQISDFMVDAGGYSFIPAIFISPDQPTSLTTLTALANNEQNLIEIGFPSGQLPTPGAAYSVEALLWWRSDSLIHWKTGQYPPGARPVFLSTGHEMLDGGQLAAPSTQTANLGLSYTEDGQRLTINRVEWSAGRQVRLQLTLQNLTTDTISLWSGVAASTASIGTSASANSQIDASDPSNPLATTSSLQAKQAVSGYITFDSSVADPSKELTLRLPSLGSSFNDSIIVQVEPSQQVLSTK